MDSYIEISFIIQTLTMLISCMTAGYLSLKPISLKQSWMYSICIAFFACSFWSSYSWTLMFIIEVLFFLIYFRYRWKTYLLVITLRILVSATWYAIYRGGFHNFQYFLPMVSPIPPILILIIILWLLYRKWNYWLGKLTYVYECEIDHLPLKKHFKGYLDTGNLLMLEDIPVIFMDEKYEEYFKDCRIHCLVMKTMSGTVPIMCYETNIRIQGLTKKKVYVHLKKETQLPMQCEILLNMNLWLG